MKKTDLNQAELCITLDTTGVAKLLRPAAVFLLIFLLSGLPLVVEAAIELVGTSTATGNSASYNLALTGLSGGLSGAPSPNDFVVVLNSLNLTSDGNPGVGTAGYAELNEQYANDTNDANFSVNYKFMGDPPDTTVSCNGTGSATRGSVCIAYVWRGVRSTAPFGVTASTSATGDDDADCPSITPSVTGTVVMCTAGPAGASVISGITWPTTPAGIGGGTFATVDPGNAGGALAMYGTWASGAYNPAIWAYSMGTESNNSWAAATFALLPENAPSVVTAFASNINATKATLNGEVTHVGVSNPTQHGFAYSTNSTLSSGVSTTTNGSLSAPALFTSNITSLSDNTTYYYRAYATNAADTGYGTIKSFVTGSATALRALRIFEKIRIFGGGGRWKVPSDWNSSNNTIEVWGGGGGGAGDGNGAFGGTGSTTIFNSTMSAGGGAGGANNLGGGGAGGVASGGNDTNTNGTAGGTGDASLSGAGGNAPGSGGAGGAAVAVGNVGNSGTIPGGGGSGAFDTGTTPGSGGGSGAYVKSTNVSLTAGSNVLYSIGAGGLGGSGTRAGGNGAEGKIVITYPGGTIHLTSTTTSPRSLVVYPSKAVERSPFRISLVDTDFDNGGVANPVTFSNVSFGAAPGAGETRYIVAAVGAIKATGITLTSVTIGGISATEVIDNASDGAVTGIYIAAVPTGTSGDVVVTMSADADAGVGVAVYRMMNPLSATPEDVAATETDASGVVTLTLDIPTGGAVIAAVQSRNAGGTTWSGATENTDFDLESTDFLTTASGGTAGAGVSITATNSDTTPDNMSGSVASWAPQ